MARLDEGASRLMLVGADSGARGRGGGAGLDVGGDSGGGGASCAPRLFMSSLIGVRVGGGRASTWAGTSFLSTMPSSRRSTPLFTTPPLVPLSRLRPHGGGIGIRESRQGPLGAADGVSKRGVQVLAQPTVYGKEGRSAHRGRSAQLPY